MSDLIRLQGVEKKYGRDLALAGVSLAVPGGCIVALLGENGAGKTTTLKIALGLLQADAGSATTLGMDAWSYGRQIRQRVGYVPEKPSLYEWMTVGEIGWFTGGFYPPAFEERYRDLVRGFGLPTDKRIRDLSKGMRAKVCLAIALAPDPELLILDEPTSGLDPLVRREFLESMADAAAQGKTVLLSSHQLHEVERVADRIVIVRQGKFILDAEVAALKEGTTELTVTFDDRPATGAPLPLPTGSVLLRTDQERQSRILLKDAGESVIDAIYQTAGVADVKARSLSLEELYFAYMQPNGPARRPAESVAPVADSVGG